MHSMEREFSFEDFVQNDPPGKIKQSTTEKTLSPHLQDKLIDLLEELVERGVGRGVSQSRRRLVLQQVEAAQLISKKLHEA